MSVLTIEMKKAVLVFSFFAYVLLIAEACSRLYFMLVFGTPILRPDLAIHRYYQNLAAASDKMSESEGQSIDLLILGGSALTDKFGCVEASLARIAPDILSAPLRIHNLAALGHTSRDSLVKYKLLKNRHYDLVLLYEGINDARINYCPPELFREDYSHFRWYEAINSLSQHPELRYFSLLSTVQQLKQTFSHRLGITVYAPEIPPVLEGNWLNWGAVLKNELAFADNLKGILSEANERGEPIILPTYAYYIPDNYSLKAFQRHELDYGKHTLPIEIYGERLQVQNALTSYNKAISEICQQSPGAHCLDLNAQMPKNKDYFDDVCHLTERGSAFMAQSILEKAEQILATTASDRLKDNH